MTHYNFTKVISTPQLLDEIATAGLPAPALVETDGASLTVSFTDALSGGQETTLGNTVAAHAITAGYKTLSVQASIATLTGYLNHANPSVQAAARAVMVGAMGPRMPPEMLTQINAAIAAQVGF